MKIGIGTLAFNSETEIDRMLDSTLGIYPTFVIDKAFRNFGHGHSTDRTTRICDLYSNVVVFQPEGKLTEAQCRNQYMIASLKWNLDVLIVLDTDEYLEFPLGKEFFEQQLARVINQYPDQYAFRVTYEDHNNGTSFSPRIILNPAFTRYRDRHNQLYFADREVITNDKSIKLCAGIVIHEDKSLRTEEREKKMKEGNRADPFH